jgi:3',5'-cyclic AMP phosphodiesterase CpdA
MDPRFGRARRRLLAAALVVATGAWLGAQDLRLPNRPGSVKFAVIGDSGTGDPPQYQVAEEMTAFHKVFDFDRVIMLGDNIYGGQAASDLEKKFARPYKKLLDTGVTFYASLGNHDSQDNRNYPPFHMNGQRYYTITTHNVRFIALDSDFLDPPQVAWLEATLKSATEQWKVVYFHHPLYSDGATHGSDINLRVVLEPLFVTYGVNVVFSGHDHIYERIKPQKGIYYFVSGSAGQLRKGDLRRSAMTAAGFDQDCSFMLVDIDGVDLAFETVSRTGQVVDAGTLPLQKKSAAPQPARPGGSR